MNPTQLADVTADPIQILGMSFYFDPVTRARGKENGLNSFEYYGLGRGGTLGDVDVDVIIDAFTFFHPRVLDRMWSQAKEKADPATVAADYVQAAYELRRSHLRRRRPPRCSPTSRPRRTRSPRRSRAVITTSSTATSSTRCRANPVHAAYLGCILMRELRGCVHIDAVNEVGLSAVEACYVQDPSFFTSARLPRRGGPDRDARTGGQEGSGRRS
jgi:hypothetical protein